MTTPIDPMAAVKLLRDAVKKQIDQQFNSDHPALAEALRLTASIEQPACEAREGDLPTASERETLMLRDLARRTLWIAYVWNDHNFNAAHLEARRTCEQWGIKSGDDANKYLFDFAPPATPPAKEAILQAMVDHDQALGLYDDVAPVFDQAEFDTLVAKGTKAWACVELVDGHVPTGAPVDERAPDVIAWLLLDQGCRAVDDCEDYERVVLASEITAEELARFKQAGRATALSISALQQPEWRVSESV